jgi:hypothetical protein
LDIHQIFEADEGSGAQACTETSKRAIAAEKREDPVSASGAKD